MIDECIITDRVRVPDGATYRRAIALKPDFATAHCTRANALWALRRLDEAIASYDRAIALKPDLAEAHLARGNALKELERQDEALESYDAAVAASPVVINLRRESLFMLAPYLWRRAP